MNIKNILNKEELSKTDIIELLNADSSEDIEKIREKAYNVMLENCGDSVYLRGLIELSNICVNDCYYCGIRKSNSDVKRYTLDREEIIELAEWAAKRGFGSIVIQSGERNDEKFSSLIENLVYRIKNITKNRDLPNGLGITLSLGEQTKDTYSKWFNYGAHRYLLRIESSNKELYEKIHPKSQNYYKRLDCLRYLKEIGYQVGTGIMIGLPEQTIENLAEDILFFKSQDFDMIGMGPYIVHLQTPMSEYADYYYSEKENIYQLALKMIAVTRIVLKDVNIASTTALQAMNFTGREEGLLHGANVIMPQLTPVRVRREYQLYEGKPCLDEMAGVCASCIEDRVVSIGRNIAYNNWGDSHHFGKRSNQTQN